MGSFLPPVRPLPSRGPMLPVPPTLSTRGGVNRRLLPPPISPVQGMPHPVHREHEGEEQDHAACEAGSPGQGGWTGHGSATPPGRGRKQVTPGAPAAKHRLDMERPPPIRQGGRVRGDPLPGNGGSGGRYDPPGPTPNASAPEGRTVGEGEGVGSAEHRHEAGRSRLQGDGGGGGLEDAGHRRSRKPRSTSGHTGRAGEGTVAALVGAIGFPWRGGGFRSGGGRRCHVAAMVSRRLRVGARGGGGSHRPGSVSPVTRRTPDTGTARDPGHLRQHHEPEEERRHRRPSLAVSSHGGPPPAKLQRFLTTWSQY